MLRNWDTTDSRSRLRSREFVGASTTGDGELGIVIKYMASLCYQQIRVAHLVPLGGPGGVTGM
jgi:hypothetical protein